MSPIDEYLRALDPHKVGRLGAELVAELAQVFPALSGLTASRVSLLQDERYHAHRAVRDLLERLSAAKPLVLVLDVDRRTVIEHYRARLLVDATSDLKPPGHRTTLVGGKTGRTVQQWISERRMAEGHRLLVETAPTVEAVDARPRGRTSDRDQDSPQGREQAAAGCRCHNADAVEARGRELRRGGEHERAARRTVSAPTMCVVPAVVGRVKRTVPEPVCDRQVAPGA